MKKRKRLLIIVDFQNDFVEGSFSFPEAKDIELRLLELIKQFEESKDDIVFTKDTHDENYLETEEGKHKPIPHCLKNTLGAEIYGRVGEISKKYLIFEKDTYGSRDLYEYLRANDYDEVVLAGLVTSICVFSNAVIVKTALPNAHVIVDTKGSDDPNKELEMKTYDVLRNIDVEIK